MKKIIAMLALMAFSLGNLPSLAAGDYPDVPENWATPYVISAKTYGLMEGSGGLFGYGKEISRGEFVTILCRMFSWPAVNPVAPSFEDVPSGQWYYEYVETALAKGVMEKTTHFRPKDPITREEIAKMIVGALGLNEAAKMPTDLPFSDVNNNKGFIQIAYDLGITTGIGEGKFLPNGTAKREEAAAMLVRTYEKYYSKLAFTHGFYAFSSYGQREITANMDAVSVGWSAMEMTVGNQGPKLNIGSENGNQWKIPSSYQDILGYFGQNGTRVNLGVYMDTSTGLGDLLAQEDFRTKAVSDIVAELTRTYDKVGKNPYNGVTIDFEGLKQNNMANFNAFLTALSAQLKPMGKSLYVAVQPKMPDGVYFDGYDYATIGNLADKVIVMAHDYNPTSLRGMEGTTWHKNTPLTPIAQVYYALKMAVDPTTGVGDKSKVVLAISFATVGWELDENGKVASPTPVKPSTETVYKRLTAPGTVRGFSEIYRNPYMTYKTQDGKNIFLWYEDGQSVDEKICLAQLFDIEGGSLWRIGTVPHYEGYDTLQRFGE